MTPARTAQHLTMAATVAPEDLACGDFVSVLNVTVEYPSFLWQDCTPGNSHDLVQLRFRAPEGGMPLKVKAICLPFVIVTSPRGRPRTLDLRRIQLVRLTKRYAKEAWKALQESRPRPKADERP